jgi:hypothetical protein
VTISIALAVVRVAASLLALTAVSAAESYRLVVDGSYLRVNGVETIPERLFGTHAVSLNAKRIQEWGIGLHRQIHFVPSPALAVVGKKGFNETFRNLAVVDCLGDRYHAPFVLQRADYAEHAAVIGQEYAERAEQHDWPAVVEFWNEPYLNWAERSRGSRGSVYNDAHFDRSAAVDGGPVTIKGRDEPLQHLVWRRLWAAYFVTVTDKKTGERKKVQRMAWSVPVPEGLAEGETFTDRERWYWTDRKERTFTVVERWHPVDKGAIGWWSGPQNRRFYEAMYLPFAQAVKETNPSVTVLGGWDFEPSRADWGVWRQLYEPVLRKGIQWTDGWTEHHYGVDPLRVHTWYEMIAAWSVTEHDRWLPGWATECDGELDPAIHGYAALPKKAKARLRRDAAKVTYHLRDMLGLLARSPAKIGGRAWHQADRSQAGAAVFGLLRSLRGRMMLVEGTDDQVWAVSSNNGERLTLAVWNDGPETVELTSDLTAPAGATLGAGQALRIVVDAKGRSLQVQEEELQPGEPLQLATHQAVVICHALQGDASDDIVVSDRNQTFFPGSVLRRLPAHTSSALRLDLPDGGGALPRAAWLSLIIDGEEGGEPDVGHEISVDGIALPQPALGRLVKIPLSVDQLGSRVRLRLEAGSTDLTLVMASVEVLR